MNALEATDAYRSPLPMMFGLECHPNGAVAQDAEGIRNIGGALLLERPSWSNAAAKGVSHPIPEAIAPEGHVLDEDLHPSDER